MADTYQVAIDSATVYEVYVSRATTVQVTIKNEGTKTAWLSSINTPLTSGLTSSGVGTPDNAKGFSLAAGASITRPGRGQIYAICASGDTTTLSVDVIAN